MFESPWHLLILGVVILVLFGGRKIPEVMKGLGQGVREFKEGMRGEPQQPAQSSQPANPPVAATPASAPVEEKK
jgi:sec-independent protein translocase protein TatA